MSEDMTATLDKMSIEERHMTVMDHIAQYKDLLAAQREREREGERERERERDARTDE